MRKLRFGALRQMVGVTRREGVCAFVGGLLQFQTMKDTRKPMKSAKRPQLMTLSPAQLEAVVGGSGPSGGVTAGDNWESPAT
jgi:hypothetical protein